MKTTLRLLAATLAATAACAWGAPRPLPPLQLADANGGPVSSGDLTQGAPWVIAIIDADKHFQVPARFRKAEGEWAGRLVVVATGSLQAFRRLVAQTPAVAGVRWYRDTSGQLLKRLEVSGTPSLLGIRPDNTIAWQVGSISERPDKAQAVVSEWLATANPPQ